MKPRLARCIRVAALMALALTALFLTGTTAEAADSIATPDRGTSDVGVRRVLRLTRSFLRLSAAVLALVVLAFAFTRSAPHSEAHSLSDDPTLLSHTVSAGGYHTCGVRTDGTLACWGLNGDGQATPPAGTFSQVSAGLSHTCGVRTDGTLACWGDNTWGQATPPAGTFSQVSAGDYHTCGVKTDGTLACWGDDFDGQATPPAEIGRAHV